MDGDLKGSLDLQLKMNNVVKNLFCDVNPIPVKEAPKLMGYNVGICRRPLTTMEPNDIEKLTTALKEYKII